MNPELFEHYPFPNRLPCALGRYELESLLGEGGMGLVFRGHQRGARDLRFDVAVKVIKLALLAEDPTLAEDVIREARVAAGLSHPNLLKVQFAGEEHGIPYIVTDLLEGAGADARVGALAPAQATALLAGVARGLGHLHARGLVHRDVKPSNAFVTVHGEVKLLDFGIAKAVDGMGDRGATATGIVKGTPRYLSPEQLRGEALDGRADVFALGATAYELLLGRPLFDGATDATVLQQILDAERHVMARDAAHEIEQLAPGLGAIFTRCVRADPAARWPDGEALADALEAAADALPGSSRLRALARSAASDAPEVPATADVPGAATGDRSGVEAPPAAPTRALTEPAATAPPAIPATRALPAADASPAASAAPTRTLPSPASAPSEDVDDLDWRPRGRLNPALLAGLGVAAMAVVAMAIWPDDEPAPDEPSAVTADEGPELADYPDLAYAETTSRQEPELAPHVRLGREQIIFDGVRLLSLEDGAVPDDEKRGSIVTRLYDRLLERQEATAAVRPEDLGKPGDPILISIDQEAPFSVVREILFTAGQAQFSAFQFVARGAGGDARVVTSSLPAIPPPGQDLDASISLLVGVTADGYRIHGATPIAAEGAALPCPGDCADGYDDDALTALLARVADAHPDHERITVALEDAIPFGALIQTMDAAREDPSTNRALFPDVEIAGGYAPADPVIRDAKARVQPSRVQPVGATEPPAFDDRPTAPPDGTVRITEPPVILGTLTAAQTDRVMGSHLGQLRSCYAFALADDPALGGDVLVKYVVTRDGDVSRVDIEETTLNSAKVEGCLAAKIGTFGFPDPEGGGIAIVRYRLVFSSE